MTLGTFTKNANAAWTVGAANGCLDSGSTLSVNQWYSLFVIARTDTGVVDQLCSTSATSPTLPTSYTRKRRIGSFKTDGSAHILKFVQAGDQFLWPTGVNDVYGASVGTSASTFTLSVPSGVNATALIVATISLATTASVHVTVYSPLQTGSIGGGSFPQLIIINPASANQWVTAPIEVLAQSSQIKVISDQANTTLYETTYGWTDTRGRFN